MSVHATAIVVRDAGVLIRGASGSGKSTLALALLAEGRRRGWFARLVGDDRVDLAAHGGRLVVRGHPAVAGLIERRGEGPIACPSEPAAVVRLVVDLQPAATVPRVPEPAHGTCVLAAVSLPRLVLPACDTRPDTPARVLDILTATDKS